MHVVTLHGRCSLCTLGLNRLVFILTTVYTNVLVRRRSSILKGVEIDVTDLMFCVRMHPLGVTQCCTSKYTHATFHSHLICRLKAALLLQNLTHSLGRTVPDGEHPSVHQTFAKIHCASDPTFFWEFLSKTYSQARCEQSLQCAITRGSGKCVLPCNHRRQRGGSKCIRRLGS